jgi:uncharacterized protein (TIGR03084 family)
MAVSMDVLADDLLAESMVIRNMIASLDEEQWRKQTPAAGWTVVDQVSHLAHYDEVAVLAATKPEEFLALRTRVEATGEIDPDVIAARYRHLTGRELLPWYERARAGLLEAFRPLAPSLRVPWFGPSMSAASLLTARFMETWAHGRDLADTVGVALEPTARLRHVAHIGVAARGFSFAAHGLPHPERAVRVELDAPDGGLWAWGPQEAADRVTGPALDFCLVVTQRCHRADTTLAVAGDAAERWMSIAQAFAGPPGSGRAPLDSVSRDAGE